MISLFGNETAAAPKWHAESNQRGTFSILSSCLATLALCVWSAIHINIVPNHNDEHDPLRTPKTKRGYFRIFSDACLWIFPRQTWIKIGWVFLAIFAPEVVCNNHSSTYPRREN